MGIVRVNDLNISFGSHEILNDINLEIKKGEFVTILGPNGSGKTTLLKSISNLIKIGRNVIWVDNQDIFLLKSKEKARKLSVVPQNTDVTYEFTCYDVVIMGRYPHINRFKGEVQRDRDITVAAMETTNVAYLKDRLFTEISGGERQRVILAQAIAQEPEVILLDEPISNLDPQYQIDILDTIKKLSIEKKLTVIAVLHDLNLASMYSDQIILIDKGELFQKGTAEEVLTKENIKKVFGADVLVSPSPVINKPHIYSKSRGFFQKPKEKLHIICGGGSGTDIIHKLHHKGYKLSVCVLNQGDMDWKLAKEYNLEMVEEYPFKEISKESYKANLNNMETSDAVIICPTYFSNSNIANLEILDEPSLAEKTIYMIKDTGYEERDFTDGRASKMLNNILKRENCKKEFLNEDNFGL